MAENNTGGVSVSENVPSSRTVRIIKAATGKTASSTGKTLLTREEARELIQLYDELPDATVAAREALRIANEKRTGIASDKFRELDARLEAIINRINQILV